jgi:hypothetical protein
VKEKVFKVGREHASQQNQKIEVAASSSEDAIETFGEKFADGSAIELLVHDNEDVLRLVFWNGVNAEIVAQHLEYEGKVFVPPAAADDVVKALQLPTHVGSYASTSQLLSAIGRFLAQHPGLGSESVSKLTHFSIATWFPECTAKSPSLSIVSADGYSSTLLLHLLRYTCRRSLHLGEIGLSALGSLPLSFRPTLLFDQRPVTKQLCRLIRAVSRPGALVLQKGQLRDLSCATVICTGEPLIDGWIDDVIQVALAPSRGDFGAIDLQRLDDTGRELQAQLLQYRLHNFAKVKASKFDAPRLAYPARHVARTLGACVVDDPEAESRITSLLQDQDEDSRLRDSTAIPSVVIEAALFLCHENKRSAALVGELATISSAIFKGRDEIIELEARAVGSILRSIGLFTQRIGSAGRGLLLTNDMRRRIHDLAWRYNVLSVQHQVEDLCRYCKETRSQFSLFSNSKQPVCQDSQETQK